MKTAQAIFRSAGHNISYIMFDNVLPSYFLYEIALVRIKNLFLLLLLFCVFYLKYLARRQLSPRCSTPPWWGSPPARCSSPGSGGTGQLHTARQLRYKKILVRPVGNSHYTPPELFVPFLAPLAFFWIYFLFTAYSDFSFFTIM